MGFVFGNDNRRRNQRPDHAVIRGPETRGQIGCWLDGGIGIRRLALAMVRGASSSICPTSCKIGTWSAQQCPSRRRRRGHSELATSRISSRACPAGSRPGTAFLV
jgi:hypothetical protein